MSVSWDQFSGKKIRERISSGDWEEIRPGKWKNKESGISTLWSEKDERESVFWNSREEISSALSNSSHGFKENLLTMLSRVTERVEILHKGDYDFVSSIFFEFENVAFLCCNTFNGDDPRSDEAGRLGVRILNAEHPIRGPNNNYPKILSKYYDEKYCMFRKEILKMCYGNIADEELSATIGLDEADLESFVNKANEWSANIRNRKNNRIGREVREILGVCTRCTTCGKFLSNPHHSHCRSHYKGSANSSSSTLIPESGALGSKHCVIVPFGKSAPCGNPTQLICDSCGRNICDIHASKKTTSNIQCNSCSR